MIALHSLSAETNARLFAAGLDPVAIVDLIETALAEDLGDGIDVTAAATIPEGQRCAVTFGAREAGVVAGLPVAAAVVDMVCGPHGSFDYLADDGDRVTPGTAVARVQAPTRAMLTAERTALNLLCHLSGVATLTRRWADQLDGTAAKVRDTRKTLPGLRALQKYAVRCGGGTNHRFGLDDAVLIKDNHIAVSGGISEAIEAARAYVGPLVKVEIEVDTLDQLGKALAGNPDSILLDNMTAEMLAKAVEINRRHNNGRIKLEASGGVDIDTVRSIAETGVDYISTSKITMGAPSFDIGLDMDIS